MGFGTFSVFCLFIYLHVQRQINLYSYFSHMIYDKISIKNNVLVWRLKKNSLKKTPKQLKRQHAETLFDRIMVRSIRESNLISCLRLEVAQ